MLMKTQNKIRKLSRQKGFTLVEMSVVIVVLGILSIGLTTIMNPVMNLMMLKNFSNGPAAEARLAMARMVREVSQIKDNTSISTAQSGQITFTNTSNQTITFDLSSGTLRRNNIAMAKSVTALQFTYYDSSNNAIGTPTLSPQTNIARIQASVTVTSGSNSSTVRGHMYPRNI